MPRLFVALEIPQDAALSLSLLRGGLPGARWIDVENYHLTLRYIGDVDNRTGNEVLDALDNVSCPEFNLQLTGTGAFGSKKPRAIWAGTNAPDELISLQSSIERACKHIGLAPDSRKFTPHVTLARLRGADQYSVGEYLGARGNFKSNIFPITRFVVMSSKNSVGGGPYRIEETYPLENYYDDWSLDNMPSQPSSSIL